MEKRTYYVETIKKVRDIDSVPKAMIDLYVWGNEYTPVSYARLAKLEGKGMYLQLTCYETNPKATGTEYYHSVWLDSCLEAFLSFNSESPLYMNFEANSAGAFLIGVRKSRTEDVRDAKDLYSLPEVVTRKFPDKWTVEVLFSFDMINKLFGKEITFEKGYTFRGNFYKCGDKTDIPHYGMWSPIHLEKPDYHQSAFFGDIVIA